MSITQARHWQAVRPAQGLLAPDVFGVTTGIVNLALVGAEGAGDEGWTLIDAGFYGYAGKILKLAADRFGDGESDLPPKPSAIILTHGHFDHVGTLSTLLKVWPDVRIYAHRLELPYLTGRSSYPPPDPTVGGGMMARSSPLFPGGPFDFTPNIEVLPDDGSVPTLPDWRMVETPGHSPGHVSFFRPEDGVLIAGDAFVTTKQESLSAALTQRLYVQGPPWYYTPDFKSARESVERLWDLKPSVALTGHGPVLEGEMLANALARIRRDWDREGITPRSGRYRHQAAITDESGVVALPAKPTNWVGIGLAAGAGLLALGALGATAHRLRK